MRKDSPLAQKEFICAEDLWDKPLIISHQTAGSSEMPAWLKKDISKLNVVAHYDLIYNASHFVKKGFGYAIALDKLINTTGESPLCFRPLSPSWKPAFVLYGKNIKFFQEHLRLLSQL